MTVLGGEDWGRPGEWSFAITIEFKTKVSTESRQGSFGRIGFSGLEGNIVDFMRRCPALLQDSSASIPAV